jgi:hypothetical protein
MRQRSDDFLLVLFLLILSYVDCLLVPAYPVLYQQMPLFVTFSKEANKRQGRILILANLLRDHPHNITNTKTLEEQERFSQAE